MKCPHCGRNNFNWARRCDHCHQPLSGAGPESAISDAAVQRQAAVGHPDTAVPADRLQGQTLTFNGVSYTAQTRSRQLPDADVYPLRHQKSELVVFEVKAFRCAPGTPEYARIKEKPLNAFRMKAQLSTSDDPGASHLLVEEIYEQDGHLLGFQRALREHPGPAYHEALMMEAATFLQEGRYAEAIRTYDRILALNANQTAAWCNKGVALANSGDIAAADACFERCIAIDANHPAPYENAGLFLAGNGQSERATLYLGRLVQRYPYDFGNWRRLTETAIEHDTLDLVAGLVESGLTALAGLPLGAQLRSSSERSRERWQTYSSALERALGQQLAKQWDAALLTLGSYVTLTKRNALAEFNRSICFFQRGELASCLEGLRSCHHRLAVTQSLASQLLWLLCAVAREDWDGAFFVVRALHHRAKTPFDLPRIPVAAGLGSVAPVMKNATNASSSASVTPPHLTLAGSDCVEDLPVDRILASLDVLSGRPERTAEDAAALAGLTHGYSRLAAASPPDTNSPRDPSRRPSATRVAPHNRPSDR